YPRNIAVHQDGTLHVYTEATEEIIVEDDAPIVEVTLTDEEVQSIKETIQDNRFFSLPKDVSDLDVMDGPMQYITVFTDTESKEIGRERSEEHTSELQSRFDLVCRLLLEKKK